MTTFETKPQSGTINPAPQQLERTIRRTIRKDGICILTFDRPGSAANIFDLRTLQELDEELDLIERTMSLKGIVLNSAKKAIFIAGADLKSMSEAAPDQIREMIEFGQQVFNRLAALPIPTVAAIHGAAVGGGCEIALACDYRIASTDKATKIGLPETQIGLLPAWGGSTRLPRLIGMPKALDIILAGKALAAKPALKCGLVDELAPVEYLLKAATRKISQGKPQRKGHTLTNNALAARIIAARVRPQLLRKTRGHYPAVTKALEVVTRGISMSIADSLTLERAGILWLIQTETTRNLIRIFFLQERAKKLTIPNAPRSEAKLIARTAVIGAGVMGAGIAQWISARQSPVILRDINAEQVARGMSTIGKLYRDGTKRHVFTPLEAQQGMDRITPAPSEVPLHNIDLVVEAAVEKMDLKKKVFARLAELASDETVLATNTSALSVSEIAAAVRRPERVVGLHFFNPVHRMQLVEIVAAKQTAPEVLQRTLQFVQRIGKLPVVVKDSPGFVVNRILMPYLIEAGNLFESGASINDLDAAMLDFGMPMGPMRLLDEVGTDVSLHVAETLAAAFGDRLNIPAHLGEMIKAGLLGRKNGRGYYLHDKSKKNAKPNPAVSAYVKGDSARNFSRDELCERMVLLMVNESARCIEEGIVGAPEDVDFAMIMGTGFAPFRGGPLRYADSIGIGKIVRTMEKLANSGAKHFEPCDLLRQMAASGKNFYKDQPLRRSVDVSRPSRPERSSEPKPTPAKPDESPSDVKTAPVETKPLDEAKPVIDTSKMNEGQRAALELTEAARETTKARTFAAGLFMGECNLSGIRPFPEQTSETRDQGDAFLQRLETILREKTNPDEIDVTGEIPQEVMDELARLGAFGIKISPDYGGLGLSQTNYCRAAMMLGSWCGNLTALLSAHQSIGVPQPLILMGTEAQKKKFLPRVARGEISAFALTENGVGSDPAAMTTRAEPTPDGQHFIINGEKLWCTNGTKAGVIVVMAKTPPKEVNGRRKDQVTAFIVEMDTPGVEVIHRCRFMGLKALYNGVIRFTNVRVPRENILLAEGKGMRVALTTLNTGRLTLPAGCAGLAKRCLEVSRKWASQRVQWGAAIGKHAAIADKLARMAANTFAMEAMTLLAASRVDRDKHADIRLEAAMCKMWGSEMAWEIVNEAMQIRGGRGYETALSLKSRGEEAVPLERMLRDCRINTIFEGSSEIMRLFIAREALDPHLQVAGAALDSRLPMSKRLGASLKAGLFYARWYPKQWLPLQEWFQTGGGEFVNHRRYVARTSRKLSRALFHAMLRHGPKLEKQQVLLGRYVDIATELFAMTATCLRAERMLQSGDQTMERSALNSLVNCFARMAKLRIQRHFDGLHHNADKCGYQLAKQVLEGKMTSIESGMVR